MSDGGGRRAAAGDGAGDAATDPRRYGGQAVPEGVMMRGADRWAVAVRRPGGDIWLECHPTADASGRRWLRVPLVRGLHAIADSLRTGSRALRIAAIRSVVDDDRVAVVASGLGSAAVPALFLLVIVPVAVTLGIDLLLGLLVGGGLGDGTAFHLVDGAIRIAVLSAYLAAVSHRPEVRRVFRYHGAEHATISAWEDGRRLDPAVIATYPTHHVRCGTNLLTVVAVTALLVVVIAGAIAPPDGSAGWTARAGHHLLLRVLLLPLVGGLAYEVLRLGASVGARGAVSLLMRPGLWLQRVTTAPPDPDQIEVAIRAFEAVVPAGHRVSRGPRRLGSVVTLAPDGLAVDLAGATTRQAGDPPTDP